MSKKDADLGSLGRRSWLKEALEKPAERDPTVVTQYTSVPSTGIEELRRMVGERPDAFDLKELLAFMLYSNGLLDEALEVYRELAAAGHNPANQHLYIGNIHYKKGLLQLALAEWTKVAESAPASLEAKKARERSKKVREGSSIAFSELDGKR